MGAGAAALLSLLLLLSQKQQQQRGDPGGQTVPLGGQWVGGLAIAGGIEGREF